MGFKREGQALWRSNKSFYPSANSRVKYLGCGKLGRNHTAQQRYRAGTKEPWLLATNLPENAKFDSKQLVNLYAKRMQIEETFRDIKSPQYGLGLRHSSSRCTERFDILLLIAMHAIWLLRLLGLITQKQNWELPITR